MQDAQQVLRCHDCLALNALYSPATAAGYWFGGLGAFSRYGMMAQVSERRALGFPADSLTAQG
jgi:hypothetical protein